MALDQLVVNAYLARFRNESEVLPAGTELHHYGHCSGATLRAEPIWVSDIHELTKSYKHWGGRARFYSRFYLAFDILIMRVDPNVRLTECASQAGYPERGGHRDWSIALGKSLDEYEFEGLVYCERDILVANPRRVFDLDKTKSTVF